MFHSNHEKVQKASQNMRPVAVMPSPFHVQSQTFLCVQGLSLQEILEKSVPDKLYQPYAVICVNGDAVKQDLWAVTYPQETDLVTIRMVPMGGGGGKNPLQAILAIAVAIVAPQIGLAYGAMAATTFTTAANILGKMAINALAPPSKPKLARIDQGEKPAYFIEGARNAAQVFGTIPKVLGTHRMVPPLAAAPYTETIGDQQYLRMLFCWGYGPVSLSDLKIGDTSLDAFENVEIEHRYGYDDDADITLYSRVNVQNDLNIAVHHEAGYVMRTTAEDADEISIDLTFPRGLVKYDSAGNKKSQSVQFDVQYAKTGTNDWVSSIETYRHISAQGNIPIMNAGRSYNPATRIDSVSIDKVSGKIAVHTGNSVSLRYIEVETPVAASVPSHRIKIAEIRVVGEGFSVTDKRDPNLMGDVFENGNSFICNMTMQQHETNGALGRLHVTAGGLKFKGVEVSAQQSRVLRKSYHFQVEKGQYDVRIRRITADHLEENEIFDEAYWTALRVVRYEHPIRKKGLALTALRILATDQLNGVIDQFNGVVSSLIPDWDNDGQEWVLRETSNPASLYRHILQGSENDKPLSDMRVDMTGLQRWHAHCEDGKRYYNGIIEGGMSVQDALQDVAAAGRASPTILDGKWSIVEDCKQDIPVQLFTPRNSYGFEAERHYDILPHGLRIRFVNADKNWLEDELIVYDDGYDKNNATYFETLELPGVTDAEQVWRDGRYHLAALRLRPETFTFYTDIEHLVCTRGDLIHFAHDVPLIGLMSARVKETMLDEDGKCISVTLDAACDLIQGKNYGVRCRLSDGRCLYYPVSTSVTGKVFEVQFAQAVDVSDAPEVGDLLTLGEHEQEIMPLVIKSIEPQEDLAARLICVPAAVDIFEADQGVIPEYETALSVPLSLQRPPIPKLRDIQSENRTQIELTLEPYVGSQIQKTRILMRAEGEDAYHIAKIQEISPYYCVIPDVVEGTRYDFKVIHDTGAGVMSAPLCINNYTMVGFISQPSDVAGFGINVLGDTAHLSWDAVSDIDLSHYRVKFSPKLTGATWGGAVDLVAKVSKPSTSIATPAAVGSYLIKAVDQGGRESENATIITTNVAGVLGLNNVAILDETDFTGMRDNLILVEDGLRLSGTDRIDDWGLIDNVVNMDVGENGMHETGIYYFANDLDLGDVYTSTLTADMDIHGVNVFDYIDSWGLIDDHGLIDGDSDPDQWGAHLQVRYTNDDPNGAPVWTAWQNFMIGDYTARAFEFRVVLNRITHDVSPHVSNLQVRIDMPDRVASGDNIISGAGVKSVVYDAAFRAMPAIGVSIENMQTGDYYSITNKTASGFDIQFFDATDTPVSRVFDYVAKGYGQIHT